MATWTNMEGEISATLEVTSAGTYRCLLTHVGAITAQPSAEYIMLGDAVSFSVVASEGDNSLTSDEAVLYVFEGPENTACNEGEPAYFTVTRPAGVSGCTYQWQYYDSVALQYVNIDGATTYELTLATPVYPDDNNKQYRCVITTPTGILNTDTAVLAVTNVLVLPEITLQPVGDSVTEGDTYELTIAGNYINAYQWQFRVDGGVWNNITAATSDTYTTPALAYPYHDNSQYRCVLTNIDGDTISAYATVTVADDSGATYYLSGNGTAASVGAATGKTGPYDATLYMSYAVFNANTGGQLEPGVTVKLSSEGGIIRGGLIPPCAGLTIENVSGEDVVLTPRRITPTTGWTGPTDGVYSKYLGLSGVPPIFWVAASGDFGDTIIPRSASHPTATPEDGTWSYSGTSIYYNPSAGQPVPGDAGAIFEFSTNLSGISVNYDGTHIKGEVDHPINTTRGTYHGTNINANYCTVQYVLADYNGSKSYPGYSTGIGNGINSLKGYNTFKDCESSYNEDFGLDCEQLSGAGILDNVLYLRCHSHHNDDSGGYGKGNSLCIANVAFKECEFNHNGVYSLGSGFSRDGIIVSAWANMIIDKCIIHDNYCNGINAHTGGVSGINNLSMKITNCLIYNNNLVGSAYSEASTDTTGSTYGVTSVGICIKRQYYGVVEIYNNTIANVGAGTQRMGIDQWQYSETVMGPTVIAKNNIIYGHATSIKTAQNPIASGSSYTNNIHFPFEVIGFLGVTPTLAAWNAYSYVGTDIEADPLFNAPLTFDFSISSESPAVDAGETIDTVTEDYIGTPRPFGFLYDIGAYEYFE